MCLAIPGRVMEVVDEANRLATVDVAGVRGTVNIGLLDADGDGAGSATGSSSTSASRSRRSTRRRPQATLALLQGMGARLRAELEELKASVIE